MKDLTLKGDKLKDFITKMGFKGVGNKVDPIFFKFKEDTPEFIQINNSDLFIIFERCSFYHLKVKNCENFSYNLCEFEILKLDKCSHMNLKTCKFKDKLIIRNCIRINIDNCFIKRLELIGSYENIIKNSTIEGVLSSYSSGNTYQNIQIPDEYLDYLLKGKLIKKLISIAIPVLILVTFFGTVQLWNISIFGAFFYMLFLSLCIVLIISIHSISYIKMKKYEADKII